MAGDVLGGERSRGHILRPDEDGPLPEARLGECSQHLARLESENHGYSAPSGTQELVHERKRCGVEPRIAVALDSAHLSLAGPGRALLRSSSVGDAVGRVRDDESTLVPDMSSATCSGSIASPHMSRCSPSS